MYSATKFLNTIPKGVSIPYSFRGYSKKESDFMGKLRKAKTVEKFYDLYGEHLTEDVEMRKIITYIFELALEVGAIEKGLHPVRGSLYLYGKNYSRIEFEDKTVGKFPNGNRYIRLPSSSEFNNRYLNAKDMLKDVNRTIIKRELRRMVS